MTAFRSIDDEFFTYIRTETKLKNFLSNLNVRNVSENFDHE